MLFNVHLFIYIGKKNNEQSSRSRHIEPSKRVMVLPERVMHDSLANTSTSALSALLAYYLRLWLDDVFINQKHYSYETI